MSTRESSPPLSEVASRVHLLTGGVTNFYLVEDGDRLTLVDAGTPHDWGLLQRALSARGRSMNDLDAVVLTHAHADHTGFAEQARSEGGASVWVHEDDAAVAGGAKPGKNDGGMGRYLLRAEFYRTAFSLMRRGGGRIVPVLQASTFRDGEVLDIPGRPRVVHAPGHTLGCAALLLEGRSVLLSGDTLITRNPLTGREGPQIMPSGFNRDTPQALRSLSALERVTADVLLPGHGRPWTQGAPEAVRLARAAGAS